MCLHFSSKNPFLPFVSPSSIFLAFEKIKGKFFVCNINSIAKERILNFEPRTLNDLSFLNGLLFFLECIYIYCCIFSTLTVFFLANQAIELHLNCNNCIWRLYIKKGKTSYSLLSRSWFTKLSCYNLFVQVVNCQEYFRIH